jgi:oligopeptide/dipeptide ABC transporter ATP-binding protein
LPDEVRGELEEGALAVALNRSQQTLALKPIPDGAVGVVRPWVELEGAYGLMGLTLLFAAIALVAVGVATLAAADFTRPIHELRTFARKLGQGDLETPLPVPDPDAKRQRIILGGDVPSPVKPPPGCHFHARCRYAFDRCRTEVPQSRTVGEGHLAACHLHDRPAAGNPLLAPAAPVTH